MTGPRAIEEWRSKQSFEGKCINCNNPAQEHKQLCAACLEKARKRKHKAMEKKRLKRIAKVLGIEEE